MSRILQTCRRGRRASRRVRFARSTANGWPTRRLGRVTVAFVAPNNLGVADHCVTLPAGETVTNPMRIFANGDECDVVFSLRRLAAMSEADFASDVNAVDRDLSTLRSLMET